MRIIPVIDLLHGQAVHARGGERDAYRPLSTPLCPGSDPVAVASALYALHPFPVFYLADLDAICTRGDNRPAIAALQASFPDTEFWIDAGAASLRTTGPRLRPVLGTESGITRAQLAPLSRATPAPLLSLDFRDQSFLGDPDILADAQCWPPEIIVMNLSRVGMNDGPDLQRAAQLRRRAPRCRVYSGGGVRGSADLLELAGAGIDGALLASALHDGRINAAALAALSRDEKKPRPEPGRVVG